MREGGEGGPSAPFLVEELAGYPASLGPLPPGGGGGVKKIIDFLGSS